MEYTDRWSYAPILRAGKPIVVDLPNESDFAYFRLLDRYRALDKFHAAPLMRRHEDTMRDRAQILAANRYLDLFNIDQQELLMKNIGAQWFCLADKGRKALATEDGISVPKQTDGSYFTHELGNVSCLVSLELSLRDHGQVNFKREIVAHPNFPEATRNSTRSIWQLDTKIMFDGKPIQYGYRNDGFIWFKREGSIFFGVEYENENSGDSQLVENTSFYKKALALEYLQKSSLLEDKLGIPSEDFYTLVFCTSEAHIETNKKALLKATNNKGSKHVLFHIYPRIKAKCLSLKPTATLATDVWQRAGYPHTTLLQLEV